MPTARLLPEAEWNKIAHLEPFVSSGLPDPAHWLIVVVEDQSQIVASCMIFDTVHWDGFHVAPAYQKHPAVFRMLLDFSLQTLQENGVSGVHITVPDGQPDLTEMVERFGFIRAPGTLYLLQVPPPREG